VREVNVEFLGRGKSTCLEEVEPGEKHPTHDHPKKAGHEKEVSPKKRVEMGSSGRHGGEL